MTPSFHDDPELWAITDATGGLTGPHLDAWRAHIAACPACRTLNEEQIAMSNLIKKTLDPAAPDPGFEQRIIRRLEQAVQAGAAASPGRGARWYDFIFLNPALVAACVAVVALAGIGLIFRGSKPAATPAAAQASLSTLPTLPPAVRAIVQSQSAGTIVSLDQNDDDGETTFTIGTKTADGAQASWTVAADGTVISIDKTLAQLPQPVRDAVNAQAGHRTISGIEEDFDNGEPEYVATITSQDGRQRDFTFGTDGTLLEVETSLAELPASLRAAIQAQTGAGSLDGIAKSFDAGQTTYVATIASPDGRERDFTFDEDGTLSSIEVTMADLPAPLQAALKTQVGAGKLDGIDKTFDAGQTTYDATMTTPDGRQQDFSLSEQGQLISRQVAMSDAPGAVQQTVSRTVGQAKLIEIDQLFTESGSTIPYEVEAWKGGKPFYFLVSPKGDYLGMED